VREFSDTARASDGARRPLQVASIAEERISSSLKTAVANSRNIYRCHGDISHSTEITLRAESRDRLVRAIGVRVNELRAARVAV